MRAVADDRGFTLIELLVAMLISTIVMGSVVYLFTSFIDDNRYAGLRDEATYDAQIVVDRISRELRSATAPSAGAPTIQKAGSYDLVFQTVSATGTPPSGNATNEIWVRYCLDGNDTLWRQSTSTSASTITMPDTSACPSRNNTWVTTTTELNDVTNEVGGDTSRPLFTYGPTGWQSTGTSAITSTEVAMYVDKNPGHLPGPTELTSGIYLRNALSAPTASFTVTKTTVSPGTDDILLNASASSDPNGQVLSYQWYRGTSCSSQIYATAQQYDAGDFSTTPQSFGLTVTDTAGLASPCQTQEVTIP